MPVTISAMVTESWSSSSAMLTWKLPATIHCHSTTSWLRSSAGRPSMVTNIHTATPKLSSTMPGASQEMTRLPSRVPNKAMISVPRAGNKSINQAYSNMGTPHTNQRARRMTNQRRHNLLEIR